MRLPDALGTGLVFIREEEVTVGLSGAAVHRLLDADGVPVAYAKAAGPQVPDLQDELRAEADRLVWLHGRGVAVPELLAFDVIDGTAWLLTRAVAGTPASGPWPAGDRDAVVVQLAECLHTLHAVDRTGCPFDRSLPVALEHAASRTEAGMVDRSWRERGADDRPATTLLGELTAAVEQFGPDDLVVSHGDFCLPNVLLRPDGPAALVDLGRAGVADRHSDVADLLRSLRNAELNPQFGESYAQLFLDAYGRDGLSEERLRVHDLVERFFWPVSRQPGPAGPVAP
ncbi:phosphotransferase [Streptomyces meridianus]|uniref:Aminoglycoside 3'-phosphotransferase n=1 Tax=Streptomyces meridianus TaxID=2938945 RepID=A0ABT0XAN2_9ACTN|nr:aminoglycoside 3'-phosphotransferase [Streptomyces meridianus]MCM2579577.1 aminoglycoside 3'-phosphotransferase [Streptomyces meridianus]